MGLTHKQQVDIIRQVEVNPKRNVNKLGKLFSYRTKEAQNTLKHRKQRIGTAKKKKGLTKVTKLSQKMSLKDKVDMIETFEKIPTLTFRQLAILFGCGKSSAHRVINAKEEILSKFGDMQARKLDIGEHLKLSQRKKEFDNILENASENS